MHEHVGNATSSCSGNPYIMLVIHLGAYQIYPDPNTGYKTTATRRPRSEQQLLTLRDRQALTTTSNSINNQPCHHHTFS